MDKQNQRALALQACGEYMMKHIADIMVEVQDKRSQSSGSVLNEKTLITIEAQVKAIAEMLTLQAKEELAETSLPADVHVASGEASTGS